MRRRVLPHGWPDAVRQLAVFAGAYLLYELVRGLAGHADAARAMGNATRVIEVERGLHIFVEPAIQAWALHVGPLIDLAAVVYVGAHTVVTAAALIFIYVRRNGSFYFVRNMFVIAMGLALVGYALVPTAPPRLLPGWGFVDAVRQFTGLSDDHGTPALLLNPYAAIPSMHVCFAALTGGSMARLVRARAARLAWRLYPLAIVLVVVVTGNHYLADVVLGLLAAALSAVLSHRLLARARPDVWAFDGATA